MSESRASGFNDLSMLPPGELRGEVPTRVMGGTWCEGVLGLQALPVPRQQKRCFSRNMAHCLCPSPGGPLF